MDSKKIAIKTILKENSLITYGLMTFLIKIYIGRNLKKWSKEVNIGSNSYEI